MDSMKRQKDRTLKEELPRLVGAQYATGDQLTTEDEMVGWHHRLDGHGFEWTPGVGDKMLMFTLAISCLTTSNLP